MRHLPRAFDATFAAIMIAIALPAMAGIAIAVRLTSRGPAIFSSPRIGADGTEFTMYKFRSMRVETPSIATHLLEDPESHLTPIGSFLRRYSLDELPQLLNILTGDMAVIGPRPALNSQDDLIALRKEAGVSSARPGLTGLAQVNGRDELSIPEKVAIEVEYLHTRSFALDLNILLKTAKSTFRSQQVSH